MLKSAVAGVALLCLRAAADGVSATEVDAATAAGAATTDNDDAGNAAAAAAAAAAVAGVSDAGDGACTGDMLPKGLSPAEIAALTFEASDVDASGELSVAELATVTLADRHLAVLAVFDLDRDGFDEVDLPNFLGAFDTSGNGKVDIEEFEVGGHLGVGECTL